MSFDAGFMYAVTEELKSELVGARAEKLYQPEKHTVVITFRLPRERGNGEKKLYINAGANAPRIHMTDSSCENPKVPPMFCMLMRKHIVGARLSSVNRYGFERVAELEFDTYDEMGYPCKKYLMVEIMGKCSNVILLTSERRILGAIKTVDFTTSQKRCVLPGMTYELPPSQEGKISPFDDTREAFSAAFDESDLPCDRFFISRYLGISPVVARELAYHAETNGDAYGEISSLRELIERGDFTPTALTSPDGAPVEYSFFPIKQYGSSVNEAAFSSFAELCDSYFGDRTRVERIKQRSADITKLLTNAQARIERKLSAQLSELERCRSKEQWRICGDLITANIYKLKKGMSHALLEDYYNGGAETDIKLDERLTPSQNAQKYYKKYQKAKSAETALSEQIAIARSEISYLATVADSLTKAENESDLEEIRRELYESGYASRMRQYSPKKRGSAALKPLEFTTGGGYRVLCGKNNSQNDYITHKLASKGDLWFHAKNVPGSHVVLFCSGEEPPESDFTEAATIAAYYSKATGGRKVEVDYTRVKNIKKPPGSKPGYVTYSTNYSAYVTPSRDEIERLKTNTQIERGKS